MQNEDRIAVGCGQTDYQFFGKSICLPLGLKWYTYLYRMDILTKLKNDTCIPALWDGNLFIIYKCVYPFVSKEVNVVTSFLYVDEIPGFGNFKLLHPKHSVMLYNDPNSTIFSMSSVWNQGYQACGLSTTALFQHALHHSSVKLPVCLYCRGHYTVCVTTTIKRGY